MISQSAIRPSQSEFPSLFIRPPKGWMSIGFRELWEYRELLYFLTWRDIKVRYKQTALGAAWAIIQPFFMMVVFRSEEHTSELQSHSFISYAVFCLKKK